VAVGSTASADTPFDLHGRYHHGEGVALGNLRGGRAHCGGGAPVRWQRWASAMAFPAKGGGWWLETKAVVLCGMG
jgi:hypothetical protein